MYSNVFIWVICGTVLIANSQSLPYLKHDGPPLSNNSFIYYPDIGGEYLALQCVTNRENCCNESNTGGWRDWRGRPVHQGVDGVTCLYVTRGDGVISLHRKSGCTPDMSGLWRCDIPDSSGEMQSLYIYISDSITNYGEFITLFCSILSTPLEYRKPVQLSVYELYTTH